MIYTATELANDSTGVIDNVLERREPAQIQRHGKVKVEIRRKAGVSKKELLEILSGVRFSAEDQKQLTAATRQASEVIGYAGGH